MDKINYLQSTVLKDFRSFYRELLLLQSMALGNIPSQGETALSAPETQTIAYRIRRRLEDILIAQHTEVSSQIYAASYYREAQYIMVALADEVFINLNWRGKEEWKDNLLESLMYNTQDSGDKFFDNLNRFLDTGNSQGTDMAALYLMALGLGFKGKYRGTKNEDELFAYRKKLYRYIAYEDIELLENKSHLFPEIYENIISDRQNIIIPDSQPWWLSLGIIFMGFLGISSLFWLTHLNSFSSLVNSLGKWSQL